jgi:hypothetical protein
MTPTSLGVPPVSETVTPTSLGVPRVFKRGFRVFPLPYSRGSVNGSAFLCLRDSNRSRTIPGGAPRFETVTPTGLGVPRVLKL